MKDTEKTSPKNKRHNQVTFKPYAQNQAWLLPPTLGELIPEAHICRLVSDAINGMDLDPILNTYEGGGSSTYHPRLMLKALVYGYVDKRYSSRDIEKAIKENICFMWLCGMQQPDHNTLNRFRNSQLKQTVTRMCSPRYWPCWWNRLRPLGRILRQWHQDRVGGRALHLRLRQEYRALQGRPAGQDSPHH